ncbi:MAG: dihydrolipoamide acetyltransferase family protein [Propionibacteriaceae bacterium]|nr:dihydrolipoamide acetyltransferase family protein [Propionibacteriaceae bacterium]
MAKVVVMPQLGNSVESCLIISWEVAVGDTVDVNTVLCSIETDKASMDVPSTDAGTVLKILWNEGDDVPVKEPIVILGEPGEAVDEAALGLSPAPAAAEAAPEAEAAPTQEAAPVTPAATAAAATGAVSPRARNLASDKGIDLASVTEGSGPRGRVIERDVVAAIASAPAGTGLGGRLTAADREAASSAPSAASPALAATAEFPGAYTDTPLKGIRKIVAERMMNSLATSAQLTYTSTANAAGLLALRKRLKGSDPVLGLSGVTIGDLVGFAVIKTLLKHPVHNAHLENGVLRTFEQVHLGFACDTPRGLLVPTVRHACSMSLREFSAVSKQLANDAIEGKINPDLLAGATFTVSNLGSFGIESFTPLINVPQTAILGVDAIFPRAVVNADGSVGVQQRIGFSLTADHQVIDGADAARFLKDLVFAIENIDVTVLG